jgi:hypothetical protein
MKLYLVCNGRYEDTRYYAIPALDGMDALDRFVQYAKENDIEIDSPQFIKPIDTEEITVLV